MKDAYVNFLSGATLYTAHIGVRESTANNVRSAFVSVHLHDEPTDDHLDRLAAGLGALSKYTKRGDFPALDKAWDAHNKHLIRLQRAVLTDYFAIAADTQPEMRFSRKAGCSCGCSPGWLVKGLPRPNAGYRRQLNIWIAPATVQPVEDASTACVTL